MRLIIAALCLLQSVPALAQDVAVRLFPAQPLIERTRFGQAVNFDIELENRSGRSLELKVIRAAIRDPSGAIAQRLELNDNGSLPGIETVPGRTWKPGESRTLLNPFHTLSGDLPLGRIGFEFEFQDDKKSKVVATAEVSPAPYVQKIRLVLPMPGRVLVWDGHDYYSHHRRWDFSNPTIKRLGLLTNSSRYSFDLVIVDGDGGLHSGDENKPDDYFSYGTTVVAPGDGVVVGLVSDAPNEPAEPTAEMFRKDPMWAVFGNYIVIDHGNGEFSHLGHLKRESIRVRKGDRVRQGQAIAEAGASGTSLFPHLHYQLATRAGLDGEGLPVRFDQLTRVTGATRKQEADAWIDSGDIVETAATGDKPH